MKWLELSRGHNASGFFTEEAFITADIAWTSVGVLLRSGRHGLFFDMFGTVLD